MPSQSNKDTLLSLATQPKQVSNQDIVNYYEQCEIDYRWFWRLNQHSAMHYGYWDNDTQHLGEALDNMNLQIMNRLELSSGLKVLDAGCGVGGTARYIASRHSVAVEGISLSPQQIQRAREVTQKENLQEQINYSVQDFRQTEFSDAYFDRIYGIESICHANDKKDFLAEAFRLLKPGGRLVVADFFISPRTLTTNEQFLLDQWADTWVVPYFEKIDRFKQLAQFVGLTLESAKNASSHIYKSARRLHLMFYPCCNSPLRIKT